MARLALLPELSRAAQDVRRQYLGQLQRFLLHGAFHFALAAATATQPRQPPTGGEYQGDHQQPHHDPQEAFADECQQLGERAERHVRQIFFLLGVGVIAGLLLHPAADGALGAQLRVFIHAGSGLTETGGVGRRFAKHAFRRGCRCVCVGCTLGLFDQDGRCVEALLRVCGQHRQCEHRQQHHQHRRVAQQAFAQAAEGDLYIPGFQRGTPVEVQAKPRAAEERADQRHRRPGQQVEADPRPRRGVLADQLPGGAQGFGQPFHRHEHEEQGHAGQLQHHFEMPARPGQQRGMAIAATAQCAAAQGTLAGIATFEQIHRHQQRTRRAEAAPCQIGKRAAPAPVPLRAQGFGSAGLGTECAARNHVQRDALERRLQPPQREGRQPQVVQPPAGEIEQREHRQCQQQPRLPDGAGMTPHQCGAQLHRFPLRTCAQHHVELINAHRQLHRDRRATTTQSPGSTARRTQ
ncbi:hypothetical protein D3C71_1077120 [compost metagenome]